MKIEFYNDNPNGFWNDTINILVENEAQNSIIIKCAKRFKDGESNNDWYCATVKDANGSVVLSAMCTPPFNVVLYGTGNKIDTNAVELLVRELHNAGYILNGVTGEKVLAEMFSECYTKLANKNSYIRVRLNSMVLKELSDIDDFASGFLREITEEDLCYLPFWFKEWAIDCNQEIGDIAGYAENIKNQTGKNLLYVWVDKTPVSMAGLQAPMVNGTNIGRVYTPPHYRNKGYGTACVWHLSKLLLDKGNKFVSLFADADYPVSNKVYQKVGFRNVCLYQEMKFE
ncbi:MAG: GNAT family N-acetyltransferase [Oscillospiraceae bacterium]|nr:GNAT family N-acetyltransferase [Oscillospiraceae bacterium]